MELVFNDKDNNSEESIVIHEIMHGEGDPYGWESAARLTYVERHEEEDFGMYIEEREGRKRKWQYQESGKAARKNDDGAEDRELRRGPPKKVFTAVGDVSGSGTTSSSSSHMTSPGWQVNDLDLDLPGELSMNEALLSLPSLSVFKQEAPSPSGPAVLSPPRRAWPPRRLDERQGNNVNAMVVDNGGRDAIDDGMCQQTLQNGNSAPHSIGSPDNMQCQAAPAGALVPMNGYQSPTCNMENKGNGLLMCSPANSLDGFLHSPIQTSRSEIVYNDDNRFQYVLAAATSIATKQHEETLTYLNQGQPYEIKLKKLGDLSHYKGKMLKSVIKMSFHERRLQYAEREQLAAWARARPGERVLDADVPLSYGLVRLAAPLAAPAALHVYWDPTKDVGVYVKVNCISTEFTAKKHGGEKGVPFRIQVETYLANNEDQRLHAAACQIKVFKLKGADRKHKQDREKVMRRPRSDLDKYQPGCDATVLTTLSNDALLPLPSLVTASPRYSPELCMTLKPNSVPVPCMKPAILAPVNQMKPIYCQDTNEVKVNTPPCHSPDSILPDLPQPPEDTDKNLGLSNDADSSDTQAWLNNNRFSQHTATFANFSGSDLLRLSRDDIIQICGLADGIRLYNALHAKRIEPRLTLYVSSGGGLYNALFLREASARELLRLLPAALPSRDKICNTVLVSGPRGARVRLTDELVSHLPDHSTYKVEALDDSSLLMTPTNC